MADKTYLSELTAWRDRREEDLKAPHGWLSTAGLFWLNEGENRMGTGAACPIRLLPGSGPDDAGTFIKAGDSIYLEAAPGVEIQFESQPVTRAELPIQGDSSDAVTLGGLRIYVLKRGLRYGVRIFDPENPARKHFKGCTWFPVDERLRLAAQFAPFDLPRPTQILNLLGDTEEMMMPGILEFRLDETLFRLEPFVREDGKLWILFRDLTNGELTYPAGRYLMTDPPQAGEVVLDFNRSYNPPCAFTPFATCPLPPPANRLPVRIEAGEMYAGH